MIRVLLALVLAFGLPMAVYILWRTFAPTKVGGSEKIHDGGWETMPWLHLAFIGVGLLVAMMIYLAFDLDTGLPPTSNN